MRRARAEQPGQLSLGCIALVLSRLWRMNRFGSARHRLPRALVDRPASVRVSAVVPARDEATAVGSCVAALCRSGAALAEVIVVDDGSADGTAALALAGGDQRVRVTAAPALAPGLVSTAR